MPEEKSAPSGGLMQLVTPLRSVPEQIGAHVLAALNKPNTVALLSMVVPGVERDQVVSVPLSPQQFQAIQQTLAKQNPDQTLPPEVRRAIGFRSGDEEE